MRPPTGTAFALMIGGSGAMQWNRDRKHGGRRSQRAINGAAWLKAGDGSVWEPSRDHGQRPALAGAGCAAHGAAGEVQQLDQRVVGREMPAGLGDLAEPVVDRFDCWYPV
jgi:hypothetical protein